ncbi:hypothetical protein [Phenylobacterium montanum]|uniref:Uncharacterized protein n=1 Tax=Phenylobacterium montanum TaxID=2823693 RepID=A0A975IUD1_9CAUL|nr:hypothetical protein [Caulobacter sp. S6]QUD87630.1 hypothetical protein KCG34_21695 [Caulobacter sp. S6]
MIAREPEFDARKFETWLHDQKVLPFPESRKNPESDSLMVDLCDIFRVYTYVTQQIIPNSSHSRTGTFGTPFF